MQANSSRLIAIPFFLVTLFFMPGETNEINLKSNHPKNISGKLQNISCADQENVVSDFERSFDHKNRVLIERVNESNNFIDFLGIGPSRYPENRMVKESKKMWDTFECHLSRLSEKYKLNTKDIFNGYNSSLSNFE